MNGGTGTASVDATQPSYKDLEFKQRIEQGSFPSATYVYQPLSGNTTVTLASVDLSGLKVNIRYIVTPEPGTMALLLTGIPLLLVRRRKSLKK